MLTRLESIVKASIAVKQELLDDKALLGRILEVSHEMEQIFRNGGKVLFCGNGGSAADAQHLAAEFSGRFYYDRPPLFSEALHVNTSYLTAVANDYSFEMVYARMVNAMGRKGDMLVGLSTSGNSTNIVKAIDAASQLGMKTVGFTGTHGGLMKDKVDWLINVPSTDTPRIQESHILLGHILCELVEGAVFPKK